MPEKVMYIERKTIETETLDIIVGTLDFYANPNNYLPDQDVNSMNGEVTDYPDGRVEDDGGRMAGDALGILAEDEERRVFFSQEEYLKERAAQKNGNEQ